MTKLDQIKILDNKIKTNKAQYMLDRKNAEISAKSSGELDKYEYLTGEDLGYKPDALTQTKLEYSPLGKTLTFGSTKDDKKEGLLKRLANINKVNNLSNLRGINTNIYPRDIDYYRLNKDKIDRRRFYDAYNKLESLEEKFFMINEFYKNIEKFKNDDNILSDDTNKKNRFLNNTSIVYNNLLKRYKEEYLEKYKQHNEEWKKKYDYKNFNDLTDDKIFNIDLSWMYNLQLYDEISQDVADRYDKDKKSNGLKSIQTVLDSITNEHIKNKKDALEEFKTIKNNVKSENLKDIVKELELAIFEYDDDYDDDDDDDDDDEEPKYEENIAERTKMRRQKDALRTFAPPDPDSDGLSEWIVYDKDGFDSNGYNINGIKTNGFKKDGYNINGYDFLGLNKDCNNINGVKGVYDYKDTFVYNRYGYNEYGLNKNGFNRNGYNKYGFDEDGYNKYSYNKYGFNRNGLSENRLNKYGKKNIPGSGLKILTPQQMLAQLPILLAQIKAGNNSLELKNEIRQLLYSLYRSKQISKTVYKNLIATI